VTRGGRALPIDRLGTRGIVLRDPDGFYIRLAQLPRTATAGSDSPPTNVIGLRMQYTIAAPAAIVRFYHGVLGLRVRAGAFTRDSTMSVLFDASGAQRALTQAAPLGEALQFAAFRHIPRHTYGGRPQDAGTPTLALQVKDLTSALRVIRASGTIIVSAGGQPVLIGHGGATILVRDSAGLLVQLIQEPQLAQRPARPQP
jgi:catechol 2,3-dioxygenase-like lactoylglutathione lyase family enzyme